MKTVLVTGGSRGIGLAICNKFSASGYNVLSPSRDELDLLDNHSIDKFIYNNKGLNIDAIINNAGINPINLIEEIKDKDFDETVQISLKAPYKLIQGFVQVMKQKHYGKIVNISSIWSVISKPSRMTYSTVKSGLCGMTRELAIELAPYNILVNAVSPGYVNTELTVKNIPEEEAKKIKENIPLKRFAETNEIADLVYFLACENNTYITGQNIVIDGGYSVQ